MTDPLLQQLAAELKGFGQLDSTDSVQTIHDTYGRVLATVQAIMLKNGHSDSHARAWSLLNDDAYKDLSRIEEGHAGAITNLKDKINQVGELLLDS